MCKFKSGIILKSRSYIAEGYDDSHTNLLEKLNIEDTRENAMRKFVRVELIPNNNEWWTNPITWKINIDQDILPDWFEEDKEKYLKEFRERVTDWWNKHVFVDKTIKKLESGYYRLKRCKIGQLLNGAEVILNNSTVQEMHGNSIVYGMYNNSIVNIMYNNSTVQTMYNNSIVQKMYNNSTVQTMYNNSVVQKMYDNSIVNIMYIDSVVQRMYNNSIVQEMYDNSTVQTMYNNSIVRIMYIDSVVQRMYDNSIIVRDLEKNIVIAESSNKILKKHKNNQ